MASKTRIWGLADKRKANFMKDDLIQFAPFKTNRDILARELEDLNKEYFRTGNPQRNKYKKSIQDNTQKKDLIQQHDAFVDMLRSLDPSLQVIAQNKMADILALKKIYKDLPGLETVTPINSAEKRPAETENVNPNNKKQRID